MSKRRRLSGRERRELRQRARQGPQLPKLPRRRFLLTGAGAAAAAVIAVLLLPAVFGGDGSSPEPAVQASPTPQATATPADSGPPPVAGEPTYTASGLGIIDVEVGAGPTPAPGQTVVFHSTIWFTVSGAKIFSSRDRGEAQRFVLDADPPQAIAGLEEGLTSMRVGGKRRLLVPPELGFGGRSGVGNLAATFDVELLAIE